MSADAYHITGPAESGEGGAAAMQNALNDAQLNPQDVGYLNAHGTSTPLGDVAETQGIKSVFGADTSLCVSSTKSMIGHLLGAAGSVEAIFTIKAITDQALPPTIISTIQVRAVIWTMCLTTPAKSAWSMLRPIRLAWRHKRHLNLQSCLTY